MDKREAWRCFENTGSVEAYLLYQMLDKKEREPLDDAQGQRDSAADRSDRS